jgi:type I restriction enzyme, S subunit
MDTIIGNAGGSTFPEISKSVFRRLPILTPDFRVLSAFDAATEPLLGRMVSAARERKTLADLRDTLRPKLISGELRVAAAEKRITTA